MLPSEHQQLVLELEMMVKASKTLLSASPALGTQRCRLPLADRNKSGCRPATLHWDGSSSSQTSHISCGPLRKLRR